jgi:hypothetical protein
VASARLILCSWKLALTAWASLCLVSGWKHKLRLSSSINWVAPPVPLIICSPLGGILVCSVRSYAMTPGSMKGSKYQEAPVTSRNTFPHQAFALAAVWRFQRPAWLSTGLALLLSAEAAAGQGSFQNLDFEQSTIISSSPTGFGFNAGTANVPHWTTYGALGSSNYSGGAILPYNGGPLDSPGASLDGVDYWTPAIQGNYSVELQGGNPIYPWTYGAAIGQTAQIPAAARSLTYRGEYWNALQITFGGQVLSFIAVSNTPSYTIYGADISAYAGQTGELLFYALPGHSGGMVDRIQFSFQSVPEPGVFALSALGALLLGWSGDKCRP